MTVCEGYQGPVLCKGLLEALQPIQSVIHHALRAAQLALTRFVQKAQAFAAVRVTTWQHSKRKEEKSDFALYALRLPWHTFLLVPFIETHVAFHGVKPRLF